MGKTTDPLSNLNMHLAQFPQIVEPKNGSGPSFGKCSAKMVINILHGTVGMTKYNILLRFTGQQWIRNSD